MSNKRSAVDITDDDEDRERKIDAGRKKPKPTVDDIKSSVDKPEAINDKFAKPVAAEPTECPICLHTVRQYSAYQTPCCCKLYCFRCIGGWTKFCPSCMNDQLMRFSPVKIAVRSLYCNPGCPAKTYQLQLADDVPVDRLFAVAAEFSGGSAVVEPVSIEAAVRSAGVRITKLSVEIDRPCFSCNSIDVTNDDDRS